MSIDAINVSTGDSFVLHFKVDNNEDLDIESIIQNSIHKPGVQINLCKNDGTTSKKCSEYDKRIDADDNDSAGFYSAAAYTYASSPNPSGASTVSGITSGTKNASISTSIATKASSTTVPAAEESKEEDKEHLKEEKEGEEGDVNKKKGGMNPRRFQNSYRHRYNISKKRKTRSHRSRRRLLRSWF